MKSNLRLSFALLFIFASGLLGYAIGQSGESATPAAIVVDTPGAPHPKARIRVVDFDAGVVRFDWLDANAQPVDSGDSLARFTVTGDSITAEQKQILAAAITAATAQP